MLSFLDLKANLSKIQEICCRADLKVAKGNEFFHIPCKCIVDEL